MVDFLYGLPNNAEIAKSFIVTKSKLGDPNYENAMVSVSGGSDSDIMLDLVWRCDKHNKAQYVWFDTGLEYQATKDHLEYLEDRYSITIERRKAHKAIPTCCKEYGQPFMSKQVSEFISRLQRHNFNWVDKPFDELYKIYPNAKSALMWWCGDNGTNSMFNIERNKHLKEFMIENPPTFNISNRCCDFTKKNVARKYKKDNDIDLSMVGVRISEGGIRAVAYKNCFTPYSDVADEYRPIVFYKEETKRVYEDYFDISHSKCYTEYGLERTGCCGCPYGKKFEFELDVIKKYEPRLFKAVNNIFEDSYRYTRMYNEFRRKKEQELK